MLTNIKKTINYCVETNRTLLVDTTKSCYGINFSDYFYFKNISIPIITDVNEIRKIIADKFLTIYPNNIIDRNLDNWRFKWAKKETYSLNGTFLILPPVECNDNIIVYSACGAGKGMELFKNLFFSKDIISHIKHEFAKLPVKYIAIHIRNTDIQCDYKLLYEQNIDLIHSYNTIYIATDDAASLTFFRDQGLNVLNFTEFPYNFTRNLHNSSVSGDTKIKNLICDIYIIAMADKLISNSQGGFIRLLRDIRKDISVITNKIV